MIKLIKSSVQTLIFHLAMVIFPALDGVGDLVYT